MISNHLWVVMVNYSSSSSSTCEPWFSLHRTQEGAARYGEQLQQEAEGDEDWYEENRPHISIYRQQVQD